MGDTNNKTKFDVLAEMWRAAPKDEKDAIMAKMWEVATDKQREGLAYASVLKLIPWRCPAIQGNSELQFIEGWWDNVLSQRRGEDK